MFKFGFSGSDEENVITEDNKRIIWLVSKQIIPDEKMLKFDYGAESCNKFNCKNNISLKYVSTNSIINFINTKATENSIAYADKNNSDLITGIYEGGLKIWECTKDLIDFIVDANISLSEKNVLDLGCGVGLIGIFSILNGAHVSFQDYNPEVIKGVTIPNVFLNMNNPKNIFISSKFYSGDWETFPDIVEHNVFDCIFTSETIYNMDNYEKLHLLFTKCLKKDGVIYVAAKTYYFGVGGGTRSFEDFVRKQQCFEFSSVWKCSDGICREIIKLIWKPTKS